MSFGSLSIHNVVEIEVTEYVTYKSIDLKGGYFKINIIDEEGKKYQIDIHSNSSINIKKEIIN